MGLKHDVAKNVRALRLKAGLTQAAVAKSAKRDVRYISGKRQTRPIYSDRNMI